MVHLIDELSGRAAERRNAKECSVCCGPLRGDEVDLFSVVTEKWTIPVIDRLRWNYLDGGRIIYPSQPESSITVLFHSYVQDRSTVRGDRRKRDVISLREPSHRHLLETDRR